MILCYICSHLLHKHPAGNSTRQSCRRPPPLQQEAQAVGGQAGGDESHPECSGGGAHGQGEAAGGREDLERMLVQHLAGGVGVHPGAGCCEGEDPYRARARGSGVASTTGAPETPSDPAPSIPERAPPYRRTRGERDAEKGKTRRRKRARETTQKTVWGPTQKTRRKHKENTKKKGPF